MAATAPVPKPLPTASTSPRRETRAEPIRLCRKRSFAIHGRGRRGLPHLGKKLIWPAASSGFRPREKTFLMAEALARQRARRDPRLPATAHIRYDCCALPSPETLRSSQVGDAAATAAPAAGREARAVAMAVTSWNDWCEEFIMHPDAEV